MPYKEIWVPAAPALRHNGVTVYHTYKDNDLNQGQSMFWYTTDPDSDDEDFDIRDIANQLPQRAGRDLGDHEAILKEAIEAGLLVAGPNEITDHDERVHQTMLSIRDTLKEIVNDYLEGEDEDFEDQVRQLLTEQARFWRST